MTPQYCEQLRDAYDAAVREIDGDRERPMLTTGFYAQIGDAIFERGCDALAASCAAEADTAPTMPRLHVVSAPVGAGKTSFSWGLAAALVRVSETDDTAPFGCVFVVNEITKAEDLYVNLTKLIPGRVAIWTSEHDAKRKNHPRTKARLDLYHYQEDLERYPVAIVTHRFYNDTNGHKAKSVLRNGEPRRRALTIVDERPEEVEVYDVPLSSAEHVREMVKEDADNALKIVTHMDALIRFMRDRADATAASLDKPNDGPAWGSVRDDLSWFASAAANEYARGHLSEGVKSVFNFARCLALGDAFVARGRGGQGGTRFIGYKRKLMLTPGMMLLDATADIDGMNQVCWWREHKPTPRARYDRLEIVHVPSPTHERLKKYLEQPKNRRAYVSWMKSVIKDHMAPGERGLVVAKQMLFTQENVPAVEGFAWDIEGRQLATTHWGNGIGANDWQVANVVFLFDEFFKPRRASIAEAQALRGHKATEGDLATMGALNSKARFVDILSEGHVLRWNKQMALRGNGRRFDEHGVCGKQRLVCSGNLERLVANKERLFPGAQLTVIENESDARQTRAQKLFEILSRPGLPESVSTTWIGQQMGVPWREFGPDVLRKDGWEQVIAGLGRRYVGGRGKRSGTFERITINTALAA